MTTFLLDIDNDLKSIKTSAKSTIEGLNEFKKIDTTFKGIEGSLNKADKALSALVKTGGGLGGLALNTLGLVSNIGLIVQVAKEAKTAMKEFSGVAEGLTFAEAISGSRELANNIQDLEKSSNVLKKLELYQDSIFNTDAVNTWSSKSVTSFSKVEQAAYRLSTITVSSNEKSIDSLDKNIEAMRKLQKETNFAANSVSLLNTQYDIASAGFTKQKELSAVGKAAINLSQAGFGDVGGATNAQVRVLKALDEGYESADKRAAQLFETTKVGLVTLDQLTSEIGILAVQSKQLGVSFEESSAALAGLTTKGVSAAEANTKLNALFNEIAAGSDEANKRLANFRDSAGKPIQINAGALKEKGLKGIIDDLKIATNGDVSAIQKIFSTKEAQEATQLLIALGDDFQKFTDRIKNSSSDNLKSEAENRSKTLIGQYQAGLNKSQANLEGFGQGFKPQALEGLIAANQLVDKFADVTAKKTGETVGFITSIANKAKALGGFLLSAFSIVAPLALFKAVFSNFNKISSQLNGFKKDGESFFMSIRRNATETLDFIKLKAKATTKEILTELKQINQEINNDIKGIPNIPKVTTTPTTPTITPATPPPVKTLTDRLSAIPALQSKGDSIEKLIGGKANNEALGAALTKVGGAFEVVKKNAFGLKNILSGIVGTGVQTLTMFAGMGVILSAVSAAMSIVTGWFDTLTKLADKKTIPELQEMRDTLSDFKNISGIDDIVNRLDPVASKVQGINEELNQTSQILSSLGGLWNTVIGQATLFGEIEKEISSAQNILRANIDKNINNANNGVFAATSDAGKIADSKLSKGIELTSEDKNALELESRQRVLEVDANITLQRQKIRDFQAKGNGDLTKLNTLKDELSLLEKQSEQEKKKLKFQLEQLFYVNAVNKINNISTIIPLDIQISSSRELAVKTQIEDITDTFKNGLEGTLNNAEQFVSLKTKVESTFKGIQAQAELDPESALKLRNNLQESLGNGLTKLLTANPELREIAANVNKAITDAFISQSQNKLTSQVSIFDASLSLGSNSNAIVNAKYQAEINNINGLVKVLNDELSKPETSLTRQVELLSQIEQLEVKRLTLTVDTLIKSELDSKKQTLSLSESILNIEQQKINLYSQENKFNLFSISLSQAKLDASIKELQNKKESLAITTREEEIKKQAIINSLKSKAERNITSDNKTNINNKQTNINTELTRLEEKRKAEIEISKSKTQANLKTTENNQFTFDSTESGGNNRDTIIAALKSISFKNEEEKKAIAELVGGNKNLEYFRVSTGKQAEKFIFDDKNTLKQGDKIRNIINRNSDDNFNTYGSALLSFYGQSTRGSVINNANSLFEGEGVDDKIKGRRLQTALDRKTIKDSGDAEIKSINDRFNNIQKKLKLDTNTLETRNKQGLLSSNDIKNLIGTNNSNTADTSKIKNKGITAQQDLIDTKSINSVKLLSLEFESAIKIATSSIENEFASREKLIKQNEQLGQSLTKISSNSEIFGTSITSANLELINFQAAKPYERLTKDAEQALAQVNKTQELRTNLVKGLNAELDNAKKTGVSKDKIAEITAARDNAVKNSNAGKLESNIDIQNINQTTDLAKFNLNLQESTLKIKQEAATREVLSKNNAALASSFTNFSSSLGSALNNILPNSNAAAEINTKSIEVKAAADFEQRNIDASKQFQLLDKRIIAIDTLLTTAKKNNLDSNIISSLEKNKNDTRQEVNITKDIITQQNALQTASDRLNIFSAKINESNTKITESIEIANKQAATFKDNLDLEQRKKESESNNNKSGSALQNSLLGFLGKNNPFTALLQQRLDVRQTGEDAKLQKSRNVTEAKKELIDTTIQKAQLDLEQQAYENSLSQTALLYDVLNVLQGREATVSANSIIESSISKIQERIQTSRALNAERNTLLDSKLAFIPSELANKNRDIDRETLSKQSSILGNNLLPGNFDLQKQFLDDTQKQLSTFKSTSFNTGSLQDKEFTNTLNKFKSLNNYTSESDTKSLNNLNNKVNRQTSNNNITITAPINIPISVNSSESVNDDFKNDLKVFIGKQVNSNLNDLSRKLLNSVQ